MKTHHEDKDKNNISNLVIWLLTKDNTKSRYAKTYNGSEEVDISNLPDENQSVEVCIFSQSLMGSNWPKYLDDTKRVLKHNREMIISESVERYNSIKNYLKT